MEPRIFPLDTLDFDLASVDMIVNTHLHFDHLGGNHLFPGVPIYVQRQRTRGRADAGGLHDPRVG